MSAIGIGLSIYTIVSEKDNLNKSELAEGLNELADSIEEKTIKIEFLRDACIKLKNIQPEECIQRGRFEHKEVEPTKWQASKKLVLITVFLFLIGLCYIVYVKDLRKNENKLLIMHMYLKNLFEICRVYQINNWP